MKTLKLDNIPKDSISKLTTDYQAAQRKLYEWLDKALINALPAETKFPWHDKEKINGDLFSDVRTDFSINTSSWRKATRVQSTPILNDPLKRGSYQNKAGENAASIAEIKLNEFIKSTENHTKLAKTKKKHIIEKIHCARLVNRALEALATQNFLELAIAATIAQLNKQQLNGQAISIADDYILNRKKIQSTGDALLWHAKSTRLRKKLEKATKNASEANLQTTKALIQQLDVLTKRYCDICYEHPIKLNRWDKFSLRTKTVSLTVTALTAIGAIGCGIGSLFFPPLLIPTVYFLKISMVGLFYPLMDFGNLIRNMCYGRMPLKESNHLLTNLAVTPLMLGGFNHFVLPPLNAIQSQITPSVRMLPKILGIGIAQNSMNILNSVFTSFMSALTFKSIRDRMQTAFSKASIAEHKTLSPQHIENHLSTLEKDILSPPAPNTVNAQLTQNLLSLVDYKNAEYINKNKDSRCIYSATTKKNQIKYSHFYTSIPSAGELIFTPSRHQRIASSSFGLFAANKKALQVTINQLKALPANVSVEKRINLLDKLKSHLIDNEEVRSFIAKNEAYHENKMIKPLQTKLIKLYQWVDKELTALQAVANENTILFSRS